jgi:XTP/dITP diphosphohydrolase
VTGAAALTVVVVSPRVAPGLLSFAGWEALRSGPVVTLDSAHPQLAALAAAGITVAVVTDLPAVGVLLANAVPPGFAGVVVEGSWDLPGAKLLDAVAVMDRLRSPGGCPWDAEQTHRSLMPYLLEEAYEAYETLEEGDDAGLREELGDVLLQVLFHARIAQEGDPEEAGRQAWSVDDVATGLVEKLVSRHPHVFGDVEVSGSDEVNERWEQLKAEQKGRASVTDGVPMGMPALSLAAKLQRRADKLGLPDMIFEPEGEGAELWDLAIEFSGDAEVALRAVARAFRDRLAAAEARIRAAGKDPAQLTAYEWDTFWQ